MARDTYWDIVYKYVGEIERYRNEIIKNAHRPESLEIIKKEYQFLKDISYDFYTEGKGYNRTFIELIKEVTSNEMLLPESRIIETPNYDFREPLKKPTVDSSQTFLLDYIVRTVREKLYDEVSFGDRHYPLEAYDLRDYCRTTSKYVQSTAKKLGLQSKRIKIEPGFINFSPLYCGGCLHFFNIIEIDNELFLIDCTYSQFFLEKRNLIDRQGIMVFKGPDVGLFMMNNPDRKKVAEKILRDGWIKIEESTFKHYMDGFVLSWHNGLYYEDTNDFSYTTPYTTEDYMRFLNTGENLLSKENKSHLGYQYRPLKDPNMKFPI